MEQPNGFYCGPDGAEDRYRIVQHAIAAGSEGEVHRGIEVTRDGIELPVAIKVLAPHLGSQLGVWKRNWSDQVSLLRSLYHGGIVKVREDFEGLPPHPHGVRDQTARDLYLVMNWLDGEPLDVWVMRNRDRLDIYDLLKPLTQIASALDYLHSGRDTRGVPVVHRDLKPSNVIVAEAGAVLVDFGLTRGLAPTAELPGGAGTRGYIAPEALANGTFTPAADRYALGAVAFFVLTGHHPAPCDAADVPAAVLARAAEYRAELASLPIAAERPDLVDAVCLMLSPNPSQRPTHTANWVAGLRNSSLGPSVLTPPRSSAAAPPPGPQPPAMLDPGLAPAPAAVVAAGSGVASGAPLPRGVRDAVTAPGRGTAADPPGSKSGANSAAASARKVRIAAAVVAALLIIAAAGGIWALSRRQPASAASAASKRAGGDSGAATGSATGPPDQAGGPGQTGEQNAGKDGGADTTTTTAPGAADPVSGPNPASDAGTGSDAKGVDPGAPVPPSTSAPDPAPSTTAPVATTAAPVTTLARMAQDFNGDGYVDCLDFAILQQNWRKSGVNLPGDLNGDGYVDMQDFFIFRTAFLHGPKPGGNTSCSTSAPPTT